jgi:uncharacterized membrane protein
MDLIEDKMNTKKKFIIGSVVIVIVIVILSIFLFIKKSEKKSEELVVERGEKVERIEGSKDFDERFIDRAKGEIDKVRAIKYIDSEIEITKRAIESYKSDREKFDKYQNRLIQLEKIRENLDY